MAKQGSDCCDVVIGGRVEVRMHQSALGGGDNAGKHERIYYGIGDARVQPQMFERGAGMTNNGKMWVTVTPRLARLVMDYTNDCSSDIWDLIDPKIECKLTFLITELDRGIVHRFRNASMIGFAEINLQSGVISGLEVVSGEYSRDATNNTGVRSGRTLPAGFVPA